MADYRAVLIEWKDEPGVPYATIVAIDPNWVDNDEDDDGVFFYFSSEEEFEEAKLTKNNGLEFIIVE